MTDMPNLFPDFSSHSIAGEAGTLFARMGGSGPPLLLLHGFPQTHATWHRLAPKLAERFTIIVMDLRGYGWSAAPRSEPPHVAYSKREMAKDVVRVAEELGFARFSLVGHDRGARVAYRLALDHPGRLEKLSLLDILPTLTMWKGMNAARALQVYHWTFLAQPAPMPETLIGKAPIDWLDHTLASWTAKKSLGAFHPAALTLYRQAFNEPTRIHAACEDYRAGASIDVEHDQESLDRGERIGCPVQILWGESGIPSQGAAPLEAWRDFAPKAIGQGIEAGHFLAEENPEATLSALLGFL